MAFAKPNFSKSQVNKAGEILVSRNANRDDVIWAFEVFMNWRAAHSYPINTFQATLRSRLKGICENYIVAQRLKRTLSILQKLERFSGMSLARMQDIGGLRAVVESVSDVRALEEKYHSGRLEHSIVPGKDYIVNPKPDGYRGIHLIFKYKNAKAPEYNGLHIELQIRTRLQHAWATAVETMGTFLGQALKSGKGEERWKDFFALASAGIARIEASPPVPGYENLNAQETFARVSQAESELEVLEKLRGFSIAANKISEGKGQGKYHLVVLNSVERSVAITPYPFSRLEQANTDYVAIEQRARNGEPVEAVLVSAGPIESLRKAYPNYFLDTQDFIKQIRKMIAEAKKHERKL